MNKNSQINQTALKNINQAFKVFEEASEVKFTQINALLDDITGTTKFVPTNSLKEIGDALVAKYPTGAVAGAGGGGNGSDAGTGQAGKVGTANTGGGGGGGSS